MNNTRPSYQEKEEKLKTSVFFIEANSFETLQLWKSHKLETNWEEDMAGFSQCIGLIDNDKNKPVHVLFFFAKIYDKRICFFDVVSRYNDSEMVKNFIKENYPVKDDRGRDAITNAMNFHHAINLCENGK